MKRRKFILSLVGGAALGWTGWKVNCHKSVFTPSPSYLGSLVKVTRSTYALGTQVSLTVFHSSFELASKAIGLAFEELKLVEELMSIYRSDSQIAQLNRTGALDKPHPYLLNVLRTAVQLSEETAGAFDVTIQPLYELHAQYAKQSTLPDYQAVQHTLQKVDWRQLEIREDKVQLHGNNQAITLNGIAQGFASDAVVNVLKANGIKHALIDAGEIGTVGNHGENRNWSVGIKHPRKQDDIVGLAELNERSLATSGDYETRFGEDYNTHHLLNPNTGRSANELSSVSIAAPTGMQADALSTAVFILGLQKGKELLSSIPDVDALFITKQGETIRTSGFPLII